MNPEWLAGKLRAVADRLVFSREEPIADAFRMLADALEHPAEDEREASAEPGDGSHLYDGSFQPRHSEEAAS